MKRTKVILLASSLFLFGAGGGRAQTLDAIYSGNSAPTQQGWTEWKLDSTVNPIAAKVTQANADGKLKFTSVNAADQFSQLGWYKRGLELDVYKGYTIELKAKLNVSEKGSLNIQGFDNSGKGFRIGISKTQITNQSDPLAATTTVASGLASDNEFHVYRIAVTSSGLTFVYRDNAQLGTFRLADFQFDNIIENGGFEDTTGFPDVLSNGILTRVNDPDKVRFGEWALELNNDGKVTDGWTDIEGARTRELAIKPETDYEIFLTRRRTQPDPWAWRDLGVFYNDQKGVYDGEDERNDNITWGSMNEDYWQTHPQNFTSPHDSVGRQSIRFEFPTWKRNDENFNNTVSVDDLIFRERIDFKGKAASGISDPVFPEGYVNLIRNGDFEDHTINNDGTAYEWTLSNEDNSNEPVGYNELWNGDVRIQKNDKPDDELGGQWAHSGTSSLRFSSLDNGNSRIDFAKELEPNKTYCFNFWHRSPKWNDQGQLNVKIGDNEPIWKRKVSGSNNTWANANVVFTTTEENYTLHLYTDGYGGWFNVYFDDLVLYETTEAGISDPQIAGKTNLIANSGFEDVTKDNEGNAYEWALASSRGENSSYSDNYPVAWSDLWGAHVRIQEIQKGDDTGLDWAHSGSKSLRISYLGDKEPAQSFEGINDGSDPSAWKQNINFEKELAPYKTYTFVFWLKAANYGDRGTIGIANGNIEVWRQELSTKYVNWTRHSVTFSTTASNHTLRLFSEFGGWFNFYLDDLFLYEETEYTPYENSYLFFGKSQNTASADVEIEYVKLLSEGAFTPNGDNITTLASITYHLNGGEGAEDTTYSPGEEITLPTPERGEHYTFGGWYTNSGFTGEAVTEVPLGSSGDKNFYAKWDAVPYTITYHGDEASGEFSDTSYTIEDAVALPVRAGYTLQWYDNAELTGDAITVLPVGSYGNKEFWAECEIITYTITYTVNNGTEVPNGTYTIESETITLPVTTRTGWVFAGWYSTYNLTGDPIVNIPTGSIGDKEFWASWDEDEDDEPIDDPTAVSTLSASALRIYPNPVVNGTLTVDNLSGSGKIEIYSIGGALAGAYTITGVQTTIDISALPSGTYIVKADGRQAIVVK
jgi:uncharacterized repeat protein (TIGR02543 family)